VHERHRSPDPSPSRSPRRSSKCPRNKRLRRARRSIWTRAEPFVGLERPQFCARFRGQNDPRVAPAHEDPFRCFARVCPRILSRNMCSERMNRVKTVKITLCTFRTATSSPNTRPTEFSNSGEVGFTLLLHRNLTSYFNLDRVQDYGNQSHESSRRTKLCAAQTAPEAGATPPFDARCVTVAVWSLPPSQKLRGRVLRACIYGLREFVRQDV
jgi:hypothetical protein